MPRRILKKITPHPDRVKNHKSLALIKNYLDDPDLWHLNRRSVSKAFAIGVFCALLPIPFQMLLAALLALYSRAHLSLAVILVWITNPLTMGPIFYCEYKIGALILNTSEFIFNSGWTINSISSNFLMIWKPLWLGSFIAAISLSIISYYLIRLSWYLILIYKIKIK